MVQKNIKMLLIRTIRKSSRYLERMSSTNCNSVKSGDTKGKVEANYVWLVCCMHWEYEFLPIDEIIDDITREGYCLKNLTNCRLRWAFYTLWTKERAKGKCQSGPSWTSCYRDAKGSPTKSHAVGPKGLTRMKLQLNVQQTRIYMQPPALDTSTIRVQR